MKDITKAVLFSVCAIAVAGVLGDTASAQSRDRVVKTSSSQPTNMQSTAAAPEKVRATVSARRVLTNEVEVVKSNDAAWEPLVEKTASVGAMNVAAMAAAGQTTYSAGTSVLLDNAIKSLYGIPYRYGSTGPNRYDCSGFVWAAFQRSGINFTRTSARSMWAQSTPVEGDERFKFGTLVFLNGLGHMGIVADENGFYHASSSKGITYSPFKGYWQKRIVGFRKLNVTPTSGNN